MDVERVTWATPVCVFVRVTWASGTTAPLASFTVPVTPPVAICAVNRGAANNANSKMHAADTMQARSRARAGLRVCGCTDWPLRPLVGSENDNSIVEAISRKSCFIYAPAIFLH